MSDCSGCAGARGCSGSRWVAPRRKVPLSGILNVDKPQGITSHDVVDAVRRLVGQRKVGHAGTLDPMATGVLLVCLGQATRMSEYLMAGRKRYRASIVLGTTTDTYDAEGETVTTGGSTDLDRGEIESVVAQFEGQIDQVPPMYSAIKRDGRPLYELAREGKTVERKPRRVVISALDLLDWSPPSLLLEVACSPGTYIRSLAHDIGQATGSGAHLSSLVRLGSGRFSLETAVSLDRLQEAFMNGEEGRYLLPIDEALLGQPAMVVGAEDARSIRHGGAVRGNPPGEGEADGDGLPSLRRVYSLDGEFMAVVRYQPEETMWQPVKVFASEASAAAT